MTDDERLGDAPEPIGAGVKASTLHIDLGMAEYDELELRGAVENGELQALADEWWGNAQKAGSGGYYDAARAYETCATELEELIDDAE